MMGHPVARWPVERWRVPRMWAGQTCAILGGGPSLTGEQVDAVRGSGWRTIAINDTYRLAPWADIHYFCDLRFWGWHHDKPEFRSFPGLRVTLENREVCERHPQIKSVDNGGRLGLSLDPGVIRNGANSGYQCINLAVQLGVKRIVLLGIDMRVDDKGRTHWHGGHPLELSPKVLSDVMLPNFTAIGPEGLSLFGALRKCGVDVVNCSPGSALTVFPMRALDEVISEFGCASPTVSSDHSPTTAASHSPPG